jgi:hypothetical protein
MPSCALFRRSCIDAAVGPFWNTHAAGYAIRINPPMQLTRTYGPGRSSDDERDAPCHRGAAESVRGIQTVCRPGQGHRRPPQQLALEVNQRQQSPKSRSGRRGLRGSRARRLRKTFVRCWGTSKACCHRWSEPILGRTKQWWKQSSQTKTCGSGHEGE